MSSSSWRRLLALFPIAVLSLLTCSPFAWTTELPMSDYVGRWVMRLSGQPFLVLSVTLSGEQLSATLLRPNSFRMDSDGSLSQIAPEHKEQSLVQVSTSDKSVQFRETTAKDAGLEFKLLDHNNALLQWIGAPFAPWKLSRVSENENVSVGTSWPDRVLISDDHVSPEIVSLIEELDGMVKEDQAVRTTNPISIEKMKEVDDKNRAEVLRIFNRYGWPPISLLGPGAEQNYWLLVQHQDLDIQKLVLPKMAEAVEKGEAFKINYAYLYDRVMVGDGKPQRWGTQASCKDGKPVLQPVEDPANLQKRREELHLIPPTVDDYLKLLIPQCASMVQDAPKT